MKLAKPFYAGLSNLRTTAGIEAFNVDCRRINDPRRVLIDFTPHLGDGFARCHSGINGSGSLIVIPDHKRKHRYMCWRRCAKSLLSS
jgi:hypothetical protein